MHLRQRAPNRQLKRIYFFRHALDLSGLDRVADGRVASLQR